MRVRLSLLYLEKNKKGNVVGKKWERQREREEGKGRESDGKRYGEEEKKKNTNELEDVGTRQFMLKS